MAQCKENPQDFIKNAFRPQIAVMCTERAEHICKKNNLNFVELLQPFSKLLNDVHYKDPSNAQITVHNLKVDFLDANSRPPQTTLARKILNSTVRDCEEVRSQICNNNAKLEIPLQTPWFEAWRNAFLKMQYPSDHEYCKHFLACILAISSTDDNPTESIVQLIQNLNEITNTSPGKIPKWFSSNILKYYVVLHDNSDKHSKLEIYNQVKNVYGDSNCFLLRLNSRQPTITGEPLPDPWNQFLNRPILKTTPEISPDLQQTNQDKLDAIQHPLSPDSGEPVDLVTSSLPLHGAFLTTDDIEQIKHFTFEFTQNCLLPYIEKQIHQLNDVISNKKGMSRSLFSATKRWFNPNKPGTTVQINNLIYATDSPELQIRRLADLCFMFGHYQLAFQSYHLAKRDYNTDQAWLYYAGALEMASLSAFMMNEANKKTSAYIEESITTYLNTCKMPQLATRATLLSTECLKRQEMYGEAAHQFIRMTSEESDLRSALFLEQAAYCFLHSKMIRKYAFHMVLAGHRYSKAAQKKHSLRGYQQAHRVYEQSGWDLSEDYILYTIGRQANNLQNFDEAVISFSQLLKGDSRQPPQQQGTFLKEYLMILANKIRESDEIPTLPLPSIGNKDLRILTTPASPLKTPKKIPAIGMSFINDETLQMDRKWYKLEELLVSTALNQSPVLFNPQITLFDVGTLQKVKPIAIVNEQIQVCVPLINSLQVDLQLKSLYLLWDFVDTNIISNENSKEHENFLKTHLTKSALIEKSSTQNVILLLTPLAVGKIKLKGICYTLLASNSADEECFVEGKQYFDVPKLGDSIEINVVPSAPCLQVSFSEISLEFFCDEIRKVDIDLLNTGSLPLNNIYMITSSPHLITNCFESHNKNFNEGKDFCAPIRLPYNDLSPGRNITVPIWVKAPNKPGNCVLDLLIYYQPTEDKVIPKYRLVRHYWNLGVKECIKLDLLSKSSYNSKEMEEITMSMKVTNTNKIEVRLLNVILLSKYWSFTEDTFASKLINLHSHESVHFILKARRIFEEVSKYSASPNVKSDLNTTYLCFAKKLEYVSKETDHSDGNLLIHWQALVRDNESKIINGQTHSPIKIERFVNTKPEIAENNCVFYDNFFNDTTNSNNNVNGDVLPVNSSKLIYNLVHPPVIEHDFQKQPLCIVYITLLLHSIVDNETLKITINTMDRKSDLMTTKLFYPEASRRFCWLGPGKTYHTLEPLSTKRVSMSVGLSGSGTYDLGQHLEIFCARDNDTDNQLLQYNPAQSALIVMGC